MRKFLKVVGWILCVLVVLALSAVGVARVIAGRKYNTQWTTHTVSFPLPFPLSATELETLRSERIAAGASAADPLAGVDLQAVTLARAIARGEHLVKTRVNCEGCHGNDLGGKVLIDQAIVGYWAPPNLTAGPGSVTRDFSVADWDRAVRHGVRHTGQSSSMPTTEFVNLSDHELSDIVAYIRSRPPVDRTMKPVGIGPVFSFVVGFGSSALPAFSPDHQRPHPVDPPVEALANRVVRSVGRLERRHRGTRPPRRHGEHLLPHAPVRRLGEGQPRA